MDYVADDNSSNNHIGSTYSMSNQINSSATMPLNTTRAISIAGNQAIIFYTVGAFGFVLNVYVIIVVALNKSMHKHLNNMYMINQSAIDGLSSAVLIIQTAFQNNEIVNQYMPGNIADETLCRFWYSEFPLWGLLDSSTYNIVVLTFERYLAIVHPIWYKTKFSNSRIKIGLSIAFVWFIGLAYNASYLIPSSSITTSGICTLYNYPNFQIQSVVGLITFAFEFFIPVILIISGYSVIAWSIHKRARVSSREDGGNTSNKDQANESMIRARRNVLQTSLLLALFFIICWSPNELFFLAYNLNASCCQNLQSPFLVITGAIIPLNCCANPIIYSLTYREFQKGATRLFTRIKKSTPADENNFSSVRT